MRFFSKNKIMEREKPQLIASLHIYDSLELYTTCRAHLYNAFMKQPYPEEKPHCSAGRSMVHLTKEQKKAAVMEFCTKDETVQEIASRYQVSRCSIYQWARELLGEGSVSSMPKRNKAEEPKPATISFNDAKTENDME